MSSCTAFMADPLTELGGMPFLDDGFAAQRLLAVAGAARLAEAERLGKIAQISQAGVADVEMWLAPSRVTLLRPSSAPIPASPLSPSEHTSIGQALAEIAAAVPAWTFLLDLPVRYALLHSTDGALSASSRSWPQHILVGLEAFSRPLELREYLVHELTHQWLYLIQEGWALEAYPDERLTLPSKTSQRGPSEVLGAAHVAATLLRLYRITGEQDEARLAELRSYGLGCLKLFDADPHLLTPAGQQIGNRLKEAL